MRRTWIAVAFAGMICLLCAAWMLPNRQETEIRGAALGMVLIDIEDERAADVYHVKELGVYVLAVEETSQAYQAGVRSGDRLVKANGRPMSNTSEWIALQNSLAPMQSIRLDFQRGTEAIPLRIELTWTGAS